MNLILQGKQEDIFRIEEGTCLLLEEMKIQKENSESDIRLKVEFRETSELIIQRKGQEAEIYCQEPAHYFRGLTWICRHLEKKEYCKRETVSFTGNGLMLDCSRNSVFTVEKVKELIRILASLGLNRLLLYIEDTPDILQVGKEATYHLIEEMLTAVRNSFHTKRVHLGMDEAVQLGLGNYLKENGYTRSSVLMKEHCKRVLDICKKLPLPCVKNTR